MTFLYEVTAHIFPSINYYFSGKVPVYERFTNPTPHSFVTLSSITKLGLGLPNKVMITCVLSKLELDEWKKYSEREFSFEVFSSSFVRVCESDYCEFYGLCYCSAHFWCGDEDTVFSNCLSESKQT